MSKRNDMSIVAAILSAIARSVPKLVEVIKNAKGDLGDVKLGDFISSDALAKVKQANEDIEDFVENG